MSTERAGRSARDLRPRLSYANATATLALFVALGGGAYATHSHKVGPDDIRKNAIKRRHIDNDVVRGGNVANGSLRLRDLLAWQAGANFGAVSLAPGECDGGNIGQPPGGVVRPGDVIIASTERSITSGQVPLGVFAFPSGTTVMAHATCNFGNVTTSLSSGSGRAFGVRR